MKQLLAYIIFIFTLTGLYSQGPCYSKAYFLNMSGGVLFNAKDDFNGDWQIGGPADINSKTEVTYRMGIGFMYESFHYYDKFNYGTDLIVNMKLSRIDNANLKEIRGINLNNDTLQIPTKATSEFRILSFILSPYISYIPFENFPITLSIHPQFIYNVKAEIDNSIELSDTNFINFLGKPEIKRDSNNYIKTNYISYPQDIRNFDFNIKFSLAYRIFSREDCCDCCPTPNISTFSLDLLIGYSPIKNRGLIIYPGLSVQISIPVSEKRFPL